MAGLHRPEQLPATALIHARNLEKFFGDHFFTTFDFYNDARKGKLPAYWFVDRTCCILTPTCTPPARVVSDKNCASARPNRSLEGRCSSPRVYNTDPDIIRCGGFELREHAAPRHLR